MGLLNIDDHISESILLENGWENGLKFIGRSDVYLKIEGVKKGGNIKLLCFTLAYYSESDKWSIGIAGADSLEVNTYTDITTYIQHYIHFHIK